MAKSDLDPELLKQAEELNIEVTDEATNEALKAAIDEVLEEDGAAAPVADIAKLRADYKALTGKNAFNGWDAAELQKRIGAGSTQPATPAKQKKQPLDHDGNGKKGGAAPALHPMVVNRDFWDAEGERHRKNSVIEVTADDAIAGAETGALSRVR